MRCDSLLATRGHSATDCLEARTSNEINIAFTLSLGCSWQNTLSPGSTRLRWENPITARGLSGISRLLARKIEIDHYVVQKSLDGLFCMIGQEEQKIRANPAAQVTPLLKEVFGGQR